MSENIKDLSYEQILRIIPSRLRSVISQYINREKEYVQEITLRVNRPVCIYKKGVAHYLAQNGCLTTFDNMQKLLVPTQKEIIDVFNTACGYSVYSHLNEIKEGFITVSGGHRIGIVGTAVVSQGEVVNIRDISSVSLRIAREIVGCGEEIVRECIKDGAGLLLCGSPCSGKTTVLRDIARILSTEYGCRVSLVDSRGELASVYKGINQRDVGMCDVFDGYPRSCGIEQAVRTFAPDYIICDEIGSESDLTAITAGLNSGTVFIASMHAGNKRELIKRSKGKALLLSGAFGKVVFLSGRNSPGRIADACTVEELLND